MNGCIGTHIEANSEGYSRDRAVQAALNIGGAFATVVNDPQLCAMLLSVDITPIHRINRRGLLDDNQQQYGNTREYIRTAHVEAPDPRIPLNWNNEPGQQDLPRLLAAGLEAIDEAERLGRTLAMLGWSYGNPNEQTEAVLAPLYRAIAAGGHYYCVHEGTDAQHPTLASCTPFLIGRFLPVMRKYGFKVLVTEFAASLDAWNGWQTWDSNFAQVCADTVREVYAPNGVYMTPFTAFKWKNGFDYIDSPALQASWAETNRSYPIMTQPISAPSGDGMPRKVTGLPPGVPFRNIRTQPDASAADVGDLRVGDVIAAYFPPRPDGWGYVKRSADGIEGWVLMTGVETTTPNPAGDGSLNPVQAQALQAIRARQIAAIAELNAANDALGTFIEEVAPALLPGDMF